MKKGNITIVVVLIALLLIGGGVWYVVSIPEVEAPTEIANISIIKEDGATSSDDLNDAESRKSTTTVVSTEGWKTYTNEKYGFEFQYPKNFNIISQSEDSIVLSPINKDNPELHSGVGLFQMIHFKSISSEQKNEVIDNSKEFDNFTIERKIINTIPTTLIRYRGVYAGETHNIYFVQLGPNKFLEILYVESPALTLYFQSIVQSIHKLAL